MSKATLDKTQMDVTPFIMLWAEEVSDEEHNESGWSFSEDTQGFSPFQAGSRDVLRPTPPEPGTIGADYGCFF